MNRENFGEEISFLDVLFNMTLFFAAVFIIALMSMNTKEEDDAEKKKIDSDAEYIITITWKEDCDVDTWVEDPMGNMIWFNNQEDGLMHLDRDDLGTNRDEMEGPDGIIIEYPSNTEIVTLRGIMFGEYVLNVHMYSARGHEPIDVTITIEKLNPVVILILSKIVVLKYTGDEETVTRFSINEHGNVVGMNNLQKRFVAGASGETDG